MEKIERALAFTTEGRKSIDLTANIQGWGADLDGEKRPGVPRDKAPYVGIETLYPDIEPQLSAVEILKSVEHMKMPPVFGTSCPPAGLSGMMRRYAFRYSEGTFTHWLALLMADRVNIAEDLIHDLAKGHVPNLYKEMGLASEWKYNRKAFVKKAALTALALTALTSFVVYRKRRRLREA